MEHNLKHVCCCAETIPKGKDGDLYFLRTILHDWDDDKTLAILRACRAAIGNASARVLLVEVSHNSEVEHIRLAALVSKL